MHLAGIITPILFSFVHSVATTIIKVACVHYILPINFDFFTTSAPAKLFPAAH